MSIRIGTDETKVIDFHVHVFPDALAPHVLKVFLQFPIEVFSNATASGWLDHMRQSGADTSVALSVPTKPSQVESINTFLRPLLASEYFIPFAAVHPAHEDPVGIIRRAAADGFKGIKLHPIMQDFKPQEPRLFPLYDAAIEEGLIVLFHAGAGMDFDAVRGSKEDFDALFERYNYERFVFAHLGGRPDFQQFPALKSGWPGYLDLSYSLGLMPDDYLVELVRDFGIDRVLFGTDGPWHSEVHDIEHLLSVGFTDDELRKLLYLNAAQLLGIEGKG